MEQRRQSPDWRSLSRRAAWVSVAILRHRMHRALPLAGRRRPHWAQRPAALWRRYSFSMLTGGASYQGAQARGHGLDGNQPRARKVHPQLIQVAADHLEQVAQEATPFSPADIPYPRYSRPRIMGPAPFRQDIANSVHEPQSPHQIGSSCTSPRRPLT